MSNSYAQTVDLTCPQCGRSFAADIYLIVDISERPDLLEKIRSGTLHAISCMHCAREGQLDMPLLVLRPDITPHILFSPAEETSPEEDQQHANDLVGLLKESLGSAWRDKWLKDGLPPMERQLLRAALSDYPKTAMQALEKQQQPQELEKLKTEDPEQYLQDMVDTWIITEDIDRKRQLIETTPELLGPQAVASIMSLLERAQENKDEPAEQLFQGNLDLLAACQANGVVAAFEQLEKQLARQQNRSNGLQAILEEIDRLAQSKDMPRRIELYRQALEKIPKGTQLELWATLEINLAYNLQQALVGERAENLEQAIDHYQQALEVFSCQAFPQEWALTQLNLGEAYRVRIHGEQAENLEQSIGHLRQALEVYTRKAFPQEWAGTQNNLALAYSARIRGERAENLEQAIGHFQQALEVKTRQAFPEDWAMTQNSLADVYSHSIRGERAKNLEQAIQYYEQALEVYTRKAFPQEWAGTQQHLADVYSLRIRGERAENLEQAIQYYEQALEVYTHKADPEHWATTQNNLALAFSARIRGDRAKNLDQAIKHCLQAQEVYSRQSFPQGWAESQNNLGFAYSERIHGERAENLEQAIHYYEQALEVYTREADPEHWAITQNNLANAYSRRIRGQRAENIEQAIEHYQQALEVHTRQDNPEYWASTQDNLGEAYRVRIHGERAENIEQAIYHYEQALEVSTRPAFPQGWSDIQNNLANAYTTRIRGERAENLEQAIYHYQQALEVSTRLAFPEDWAGTQNNLANAYSRRIRGQRAENLEQAIKHYQQALEVFSRRAFPEGWADTQDNLATAFKNRIRGERAENLEQAIYHYQQALDVRTRHAFPEDWAATQHNLGLAYFYRIHGKRVENLEQAIGHYQQALQVFTRQDFPSDWAMTQNNMGQSYRVRIRGQRGDNIEQAIGHYRQALEVYTRQAFPVDCRGTARNLGNLAFEERRWQLAVDSYTQSLAAQDALMQASFTRSGKQAELHDMQVVPTEAAYANARLGEVERAVEVLEQGRAQLLRETLERQRRDLEQLPALGFESLYEDYIEAMGQYDELQTLEKSGSPRPAAWLSRVDNALGQVRAAAVAIRQKAGQTHPQYRYFLQALPFAQIQEQAAERALVYLSATSAGGLALVVTDQGVRSIELPELKQGSLDEQMWPLSHEEDQRIETHIQQGLITLEDIRAVSSGYLSIYRLWTATPFLSNTSRELKGKLFDAWHQTLDKTTRWLWDVVMGSLIAALKGYSGSVVLIPTGRLALLPLHAAWTEDTSKPTGRRYALDELDLSYAPSAHALWRASLASERPAERLMAVDNPDGSLTFSEDEVQAVLEVFKQAKHLAGNSAIIAVVKEEMQKANVLHFCTHGTAGWQDGEQARLLLADGDLTLPDIFALHLDKTRLAVLSACETGMAGLELIEEMIGLPAGMMQAGVPGVIGSLWAVNDMSTAMLMARFYHLWREEGNSPQEALRQAQIWLRDSTTEQKKQLFKHFVDRQTVRMSADTAQAFYQHIGWDDPQARVFESPYYWAAFTYTGV